MSDISKINPLKMPPALMKQLKDSDGQLEGVKKIIEGLKSMGWDTREMEVVYDTITKARETLLKTYG